ncbi:MAG: ATP-binding protein [Chthoniobacteraceae bacterium]
MSASASTHPDSASIGADEALQRVHEILGATLDIVATSTIDSRLVYLNAAGRRFAGITADQPLGDLRMDALHPPWALAIIYQEGIPSAVRDGTWQGESAILGPAGQEIPIFHIIVAHRGGEGQTAFLSSIMRDLSARKLEEIERMEMANRYNAAIRASSQLLFDWNSYTNDITYAGDVEYFLGYPMKEMDGGLGRFRALIEPEDLPQFDTEIQRVIATRDPLRLDYRIRRKDGVVLDVAAKGHFFLDREGRIGRMIGFLADVTAQKADQDALARAHDSLEVRVEQRTAELARAYSVIRDRAHQQEAVAQLGQRALAGANLISLLQQAAVLVRRILNVDFCSVLELADDGKELRATAHAGWPDEELGNRVPAGKGSQSGYTLLTREPVIVENMAVETRFEITEVVRRFGVVSSVSVVIDATTEPLGVLAAYSTTPRTFVQDDVHFLQAVANVLTAAIEHQRAEESIRLAREQAETANRAKSEFLSRMSHELRTPLNAILGFTQLLELDKPTPSQTESIAHISRAGQHLLLLINEVLDIARIESGRLALSPEPIAIGAFLRDAIELIRPLAARHQIDTQLIETGAVDEVLLADRQRLKQVMLNLLSNAVKYNRPGGKVEVSCALVPPDRLRINVADTGRGISPQRMERLFLPFERLGAEETDIEGTGIGLALSRGIVAALNGELGVESIDGQGSNFWVILPRAAGLVAPTPEVEATPPVAVPPAGPDHPVYSLLYIEDQDLNLRLVERILQSHPKYRLLTAMQGGIGLDLAREHQPDLVLLDLNLPDMSGDDVLRRLKEDPLVQNIPVIMVSADAMGDRIEQMLALGAAGYLTKPYRVSEFLRVISEALAARP